MIIIIMTIIVIIIITIITITISVPAANGHAPLRTHAVAKSYKLGPKILEVGVKNLRAFRFF